MIRQSRNLTGVLGLLTFWNSALRYLSQNWDDYDLIWFHQPFFLGAIDQIQKAVLSIHTTYYGFDEAFSQKCSPVTKLYYTFARRVECIFFKALSKTRGNFQTCAITPLVGAETQKNGLNRGIKYLPNCIDPTHFEIIGKDYARRVLAKNYKIDIPLDSKILLFIGRLDQVKRPYLLIRVFQALRAHDLSLHLLLAGSGPLFDKLHSATVQLDNIHMLGKVDRRSLKFFYSAADAFISMSRYEGLPMTLLEASHYGLPLVLSDIPAHRWFKKLIKNPCRLISPSFFDSEALLQFINAATSCAVTNRATSASFLPKSFHTHSVITTLLDQVKS